MMADHSKMQSLFQGVDYRVARTREELEKAYRLVYLEYLKQGYVAQNSHQMRFSLFNALPETTTFIALADDHVTATATVVLDSPLKLPMDELYQEELDELRRSGKKLCEVSMLASNSDLFGEGVSMMLNAKKMFMVFFLFKHIFDYVRMRLEADYICITVNPKHSSTYDSLFFKDFGGLKHYDKVNGAPAVAKYLDVQSVDDQCLTSGRKSIYKMFLARNPDTENFSNKIQLSCDDLKYFFVEKSDSLKEAKPEELAHIEKCYGHCDFTEICP